MTGVDGFCALCWTPTKLRENHLVPKFVFDWIKQRGGLIRGGDQPNVGLQDGPRRQLLCHDCEQIFSRWEREAAPIFRQVNTSDDATFSYGPSFLPFCVSLSFRVILFHEGWVRAQTNQVGSVARYRDEALSSWRGYLLGQHTLLGRFEHHCVVLPPIAPSTPKERTLKHFFDGFVDFQPPVAAPDDSILVITKLCRLCVVGTVKRGRAADWLNTRIVAKGGSYASPFAMPPWFIDYLGSRFAEARMMVGRLSQRQRELLWEQARKKGWIGTS